MTKPPGCFLREPFEGHDQPQAWRAALAVLARLRGEGWTIRFLTSTEDGLGVYPLPPPGVVTNWSSGPFPVRDVVHSPRATDFELRARNKQLGLFTW